MKKYEYKIIHTRTEDFGEQLAKLGEDGYETVCVYNNDNFLILKKCKT